MARFQRNVQEPHGHSHIIRELCTRRRPLEEKEPVAEAITMRESRTSFSDYDSCGGGTTAGGAALVEGGSTIIRREMRGA